MREGEALGVKGGAGALAPLPFPPWGGTGYGVSDVQGWGGPRGDLAQHGRVLSCLKLELLTGWKQG